MLGKIAVEGSRIPVHQSLQSGERHWTDGRINIIRGSVVLDEGSKHVTSGPTCCPETFTRWLHPSEPVLPFI